MIRLLCALCGCVFRTMDGHPYGVWGTGGCCPLEKYQELLTLEEHTVH